MAPRNTRVTPETEVRSPARSFLNSLDNFYAPERDRRKQQAFQEGINSFSGILQEQADRNKQEQRADERNQGVQDAMREQAGQEMQGVRTGSIFRQNSRFYMAGLNETRGKAAAARFKAETAQAYQDWEGRHTDDDGTAFREWMNNRVAGFMDTLGDDQYRVAGALPIINEVANNYAAQHTGFTANRLETESFEAYDEIVSGVFTDLANGELDMDTAVARIADEADDMYATDGAAANNRVVDAAIRYANIHNDPDSILALARAHDSGRLPISQQNREKLANAMDAVEADIQRNASRQNAQATAEEKARKEATLNAWGTALAEDPYAELPSFNEIGDQQTYRDMVSLQDAFINGNEVTNPGLDSRDRMILEGDLYDADTTSAKLSVLTSFVQANPTGLTGAEITRYTQEVLGQADPGALVNNQTVGRFREGFSQTLAEFQLGDGFDINRSSSLRTRGEIYFNEYMMSLAGSVDASDPRALRNAIKEAEEFAMENLAFDFPGVLAEKNEQSPLGRQLGVDDALENRNQIIAEEATAAYEALAAGGAIPEVNVTPTEGGIEVTTPEETPEQPELVADPVTGEVDDPEYEDDAETLNPEVIQSKPDSFYREVLNRFVDGEDTRTNVSPSVLVETAKRVFGANEQGQRGLIERFLADGGVNLNPEHTAWCAGFINSVLAQNGIEGTRSLAARSFLDWGENVDDDPSEGDVVVISRGRRDGWQGHVGLFQGYDENGNIRILGGNQGNSVNITSYPADRLLGFRRAPGTSGEGTAATLQALATPRG